MFLGGRSGLEVAVRHIVYEPDAVASVHQLEQSGICKCSAPALVNDKAIRKSTIHIFLPQTT